MIYQIIDEVFSPSSINLLFMQSSLRFEWLLSPFRWCYRTWFKKPHITLNVLHYRHHLLLKGLNTQSRQTDTQMGQIVLLKFLMWKKKLKLQESNHFKDHYCLAIHANFGMTQTFRWHGPFSNPINYLHKQSWESMLTDMWAINTIVGALLSINKFFLSIFSNCL